MIVVSGTGRSGTSLWMQIFRRAGLPVLGEAFPLDWGSRLSSANPHGFYESTLAQGVNFTSNPDPATGQLLVPRECRRLVVKIFSGGVRQTQRDFLDRVLVTVRHYGAFAESVERLWELEGVDPTGALVTPVQSPAAWWFREHHDLLRDALNRGYDTHWVTFERVLRSPSATVDAVFDWLGEAAGDATQVVDGARPIQPEVQLRLALPAHWTELFDEFYEAIDAAVPWRPRLLGRLTAIRHEMDAQLRMAPRSDRWNPRELRRKPDGSRS